MLEENGIYTVQPNNLRFGDITFYQEETAHEEKIQVIAFEGANVRFKRLETEETILISKKALETFCGMSCQQNKIK